MFINALHVWRGRRRGDPRRGGGGRKGEEKEEEGEEEEEEEEEEGEMKRIRGKLKGVRRRRKRELIESMFNILKGQEFGMHASNPL